MSPDEFGLLERDFLSALGIDDSERERFVAAVTAASPERGLLLRRMLAADAEPDDSALFEQIKACARRVRALMHG